MFISFSTLTSEVSLTWENSFSLSSSGPEVEIFPLILEKEGIKSKIIPLGIIPLSIIYKFNIIIIS